MNPVKYKHSSSRRVFLIPLFAAEILSVFENSAIGQSSLSPANAQNLSTIAPLSSFSYTRFSSGDSVSSSLINANFDEIFYELNAILTTGILGATSLNFTTTGGGGITLAPAGTGGINLAPTGTGNITLTPGSSGYNVLAGSTGIGTITSAPTATLQVVGSSATSVSTLTYALSPSGTPVTLDATYSIVLLDATNGNVAVNLPAVAATNLGRQYTIKRIDNSSSNTAEVEVSSSGYIDNQNGGIYLPSRSAYIQVVSDGSSAWRIISSYAAPAVVVQSCGNSATSCIAYCPANMVATGGTADCNGVGTAIIDFYPNNGATVNNNTTSSSTATYHNVSNFQAASSSSSCTPFTAIAFCVFAPSY